MSVRNSAFARMLLLVLLLAATSACVYIIDVQQGNLLEESDIEAIKMGMTRSQVRFLLGTPVAGGAFHRDRWDYIYYFRQGRSRRAEQTWLIVFFDDDLVREIRPDVPVFSS